MLRGRAQKAIWIVLVIIFALVVSLLALGRHWPTTTDTATPLPATSAQASSVRPMAARSGFTPVSSSATAPNLGGPSPFSWKKYSNSKYGFSIEYPCDANCVASPPGDDPDSYGEVAVTLPTTTDVTLAVEVFSDKDVDRWNSDFAGDAGLPGKPFPFALSSIRRALDEPATSSCAIAYWDESASTTCRIATIAGHKAVELINAPEDYQNLTYFFGIGSSTWLEISEAFPEMGTDIDLGPILSDEAKAPLSVEDEVQAGSKVLATIRFSDGASR